MITNAATRKKNHTPKVPPSRFDTLASGLTIRLHVGSLIDSSATISVVDNVVKIVTTARFLGFGKRTVVVHPKNPLFLADRGARSG